MVQLGKPAPAFTLPSSDGGDVSLASLAGKYVVLYFYPRDNTPGCTIEAQDFRDHVAQLAAHGAVVLGVSKDSIASHCRFRDKFNLSFPLLSDADGKVLEAYGAWGEKMMYGKPMTGVLRSTVLIGKDGTVLHHWPKVSVKGHAADVLATLAQLAGGGAVTAAPAPKKAAAKKPAARPAAKATPVARTAPKKAAPAKKGVAKKAAAAVKKAVASVKKAAKGAAKKPAKKVSKGKGKK